ncbi:hypothetical protein Q8A67_008569 [Cirrhinus molitorella]|uniref:Fibronectin type-III domain-containing protein n=2 Tax=Cirrhinus molitorella TaxID=172907 RepID=A0AA88TPN1_9TELE|nr:hypothetical protein Q8A67_008569 [Cirrhinus molitorella]
MSQMKLPQAGLLLWMCVMNRVLDTASALSITHCVIIQYTNITCYWKTADQHLNISSYRLQINKTSCESKHSFISVGDCNTVGSNCSVQPIDSALHCFCADVLASTHSGSIRSPLYNFNGISAVKLPPPQIKDLKPSESPGCLQVIWRMTESIPTNEKCNILLQAEYTTHNQTQSQTIEAFSKKTWEICKLHPGSKYTVRFRAQDKRAHTHWSSWTSVDTTTPEKAPSAAPRLWRLIEPAEEAGKRRLTLLWKPVSWPEVSGVVLSYSASCHSDLDSSQWTCGSINASRRFCILTISDDPCHCSLTATNSAGTSPPAHISIPAHMDTKFPPPQTISATPLDDTRLKVEWTVALNQSESGFVVQWTAVPYTEPDSLHWEHMNKTARGFILTGLRPEVPYNLSVMSLYGRKAGSGLSIVAFTREGAPSVGPNITVVTTSSSGVVLKWDPVPLEKRHSLIRNYTVLYSINGKSATVDTCDEHTSLIGLIEGTYNICVMAHTAVGGAVGPCQMVVVGLEDVQVIPILLCALLLCFLILIIPVCMRMRIKRCLCPTVPDPSKSSLSIWSNTKPCQHKLPSLSPMSSIISVGQTSTYQDYGEKDYVPVQVFAYHTLPHDNNETETKIYNSTSAITYQDPKLTPAQAFPTHFLNQSYTKPDQVIPAVREEDPQPSSDDLLFDSLFSHKSNQADLCGYIHVSQSYAPVIMTVDAYRSLDLDECPHFLQVLPEDTST